MAISLGNLSDVYRRLKRLGEAEKLTRESLGIRRKLFGNESLEVADSLRSLCIILGDQDQRLESEKIAREALAMRRKALGFDHQLVALSLIDLAWADGFNGKSDEAEALEREALAIRRKLLGEEHPDVARSLFLIGDRVRGRGKLDESETFLNAALAIQQRLPGGSRQDRLDSLQSLGYTLEAAGKLAASEKIRREAFALATSWGRRSPQTLAAIENIAAILMAENKFAEAEQMLTDEISPALLNDPACANLLGLRCELKGRRARWSEAKIAAALALELQPANPDRYHVLAALLAITGNQAGYQQLCQRIAVRFADLTNPYSADRMAKDCLLLPSSGVDLKVAGKLADIAVNAGKDSLGMPYFQACKALCEYRKADFREAIEWAKTSLSNGAPLARAQAYAVLAMAQWQLGRKEAARAALAAGTALTPEIFSGPEANKNEGWLSWIFARVSLDEANALVASNNEY